MNNQQVQIAKQLTTSLGAQPAELSFLWTPEHMGYSPLQMYAPLLFWLTEQLNPGAYVTLGAHGSLSHLAVCQTVRALEMNTRCYAIAGTASPLLPSVREQHDSLYSKFSKLLPASWDDDGVQHFRCGAIDWLQVDGEQELEQLRANWRSWRRRLSSRAIITIHGVKSAMLHAQAGWIHRLQNCHAWAEFSHGEGMLLLAVGENQAAPVQWLFQTLQSPQAHLLQVLFAHLGQAACRPRAGAGAAQPATQSDAGQAGPALPDQAQAALQIALDDGRQYGAQVGLLQAQLRAESDFAKAAQARANALAERLQQAESSAHALEQELQEKKAQLQQQAQRLEERFRALSQLTRMVDEREAELCSLRQQLAQPVPSATGLALTAMPAAPTREALPLALQAQLIAQSGLFDEAWYCQAYPDVVSAGFAPIEHYLQYGADERRNPSAAFDTAWYCRRYPEAAASGLNPLVHYIRFGRDRGLRLRPGTEPSHA